MPTEVVFKDGQAFIADRVLGLVTDVPGQKGQYRMGIWAQIAGAKRRLNINDVLKINVELYPGMPAYRGNDEDGA